LILVSSLVLVDSLEPGWATSEQTIVSVIILTSLLTDCTAAFISEGTHVSPSGFEDLNFAARRSTAHLLAAVLQLCVFIGWVLRADSLVMPLDALSHATWTIGLIMQMIGDGW
jgi:hypothetical protein